MVMTNQTDHRPDLNTTPSLPAFLSFSFFLIFFIKPSAKPQTLLINTLKKGGGVGVGGG